LCGGTHVNETGDIGLFLITSESSAAAGVRRIEAISGRGAYELVQKRFRLLRKTSGLLGSSVDEVAQKVEGLQEDVSMARKIIANLRQELASAEFEMRLSDVALINGVPTLATELTGADADTLRLMTDRFRQKYPSGVVLLVSVVDAKPVLIASVTEDLVKRGLHAGDLVKRAAQMVGGGGGGKPTLAQAGGRDASKLAEAMGQVIPYVNEKTK
jgi:alanyl-tRNA synthetase